VLCISALAGGPASAGWLDFAYPLSLGRPMTLIATTLGLSLPMLLAFLGVLVVSAAMAMLVLLADY
jgi:hypothetical protein